MRRGLLLTALAACGSFEDPTIVIDLRMVSIAAEPPEQVIPIDLSNPPEPEDLIDLLVDTELCARIADPGASRGLRWRMLACAPEQDLRCDQSGERPWYEIATGAIDDPETAATPQLACATLQADASLLLVIRDSIAENNLQGFGGIDVAVSIEAWPEGAPDQAIVGTKRVRFAPQLPAERVANVTPTLERLDVLVEGRDPMPLRLGRCADQDDPIRVAAGADLPLEPVEPEGVREDYVVPTFDGGSRMFTETLTYQWLATDGSWSRGSTGGPRDASGTFPPLDTRWDAPDPEDVTEETDVTLWVIQRDERLGVALFESCVRVVPLERR